MDNYIYILLGIAWLVFSLVLEQKKKKSKSASKPLVDTTQSETIDSAERESIDVLKEILGIPDRVELEGFDDKDASINLGSENESLELITEEVPLNYFETRNYNEIDDSRIKIKEDNSEIKTETNLNIAETFDLKRATIEYEILKPKYL